MASKFLHFDIARVRSKRIVMLILSNKLSWSQRIIKEDPPASGSPEENYVEMLNELSFHGFRNSVGAVVYPQLIEDTSQFLLNGRLTDEEPSTDVLSGQPGRDQP